MSNEIQEGALWEKQGKKGKFMSGYVVVGDVKYPIVCFLNGRKEADKHPDWNILPSKPYDASKSNTESSERNQTELNNLQTKPEPAIEYPDEDIDLDDIPF